MDLKLLCLCSACCAAFASTPRAGAQSVRIDSAEEPAPAPPAATGQRKPGERTPSAPASAPVVTMPKPLNVTAPYPAGASGNHDVVLELTVGLDGRARRAVAVQGELPFAAEAEQAARAWRFEPATRDGQAIVATIRFLVRYIEPTAEPETEAEVAAEPARQQAGPRSDAPERTAKPMEVVVRGERAVTRRRLGRTDVRELPGAFGDPFRAIEVLPGVVPIISGLPYFYVRGAPPGNVGYFFDGIPVPMLYHFAAGPGVLHPAFVENVDLYPAVYPIRYGRFAGGIVSGEMAPPSYSWRGEASIRLVDSGAMLEAPFDAGRGSIMLGGRYSYTAAVLSLVVPEISVQYWDYQCRTRYALGARDTLEVLSFGSRDWVGVEEQTYSSTGAPSGKRTESIVDVTFHRLDLRYDHQIDRGRWRNAVMLGLDHTGVNDGDLRFNDYMVGARSELQQTLESGTMLRAGADVLFEGLRQRLETDSGGPDTTEVAPDSPPRTLEAPATPTPMETAAPLDEEGENDDVDFGFDPSRNDLVLGAYADLVLDVTSELQLIPGLRVDLFTSGSDVAMGVDPRITARFALSRRLTVTHGFGLAHQSPSFIVPLPGMKPSLKGGLQLAAQHSAGLEYAPGSGVQSSLVVFHNLFFNMTDLIGLAQLAQTEGQGDLEGDERMDGRGYGLEVMLRRSLSRDLGGFVSYTLSRSERFRGRLEGPATTDRTHVLNLALSYNLGANWRAGQRLLFYSGIPARVAYLAAARNPPRTPPFWRIDWRLQKRWPFANGRGYWGLVFEVLNTLLTKEVMATSCNAYDCADESIGPVTVPSVGVEGAF